VDPRLEIKSQLVRARAGTEALLAPLQDAELAAEVAAGRPALVWELARIAEFEELWLLRSLGDEAPIPDLHDDVYDALGAGRVNGSRLPILRPPAVRAYAADVRERVLDRLERIDLDGESPLLRGGFVFGLVVQNELQRQEAMLETLQLRTGGGYPLTGGTAPDRASPGPAELLVEGNAFVLGAVDEPWAYDNELIPHEVEVRPFRIDRTPVTNADFAQLVEDKGYGSRKLWHEDGWAWREREGVTAPLYWEKGRDGWERTRFGRREPLPLDEPVQHVSWYEADAFARWVGKRLPTEIEWERAAAWDERTGKARYPWGREWVGYEANLGRRRFSPASSGSYEGGASPTGCLQMEGDVWEWTSSWFQPYPGFVAFPSAEYSEVFYGEQYRVLRGGSWATDPLVARATFRNWSLPGRRDLFAGFRCARDV
jgi:iron(II)-dependent oxidoreductase